MYPSLEPDHYYHIYNRGNNGENLFVESKNYNFFLKKYAKYCYPVVDTFAYCLLRNHFHLFVKIRNRLEVEEILTTETIDDKITNRLTNKELTPKFISQQLGHCFNSYTQAFNKLYGRTGSLFERPFERHLIEDEDYYCNIVCYIHRNAQKHKIVKDSKNYPYSSYHSYFSKNETKLNRKEIIDWFGSLENFEKVHEEKAELDKYRIE